MFHSKRHWSVAPVASPEELAYKLTEQSWTLCTGFELCGWIFLNDATSEDGAQEYGVIERRDGKLVQVESVTFSWMDREQALAFIREALSGELVTMYGEVDVYIESFNNHKTCHFCA